MKKTFFTLTALTSIAASSLSAASYDSCPTSCDPCGVDFCNWDCLDGEFTLYGDWLYWKTRRCDLNYAMTTTTVPSADPSEILGLKSKYESGFRLGAYYTANEGFTFGGRYTHFKNSFSDTYANAAETFLVNRPHPVNLTEASYVNPAYDITYNIGDLELGMTLPLSEKSKVYAFATTRFASIDEKLTTIHADNADIDAATAINTTYESNDIHGIGTGIGFELQKEVFCGIGLYSRTLLSLMFTDYDMKFRETSGTLQQSAVTLDTKIKGECILPVIEFAAGLQYDANLCGIDLFAAGGYEFVSWVGAKDFINFVDVDQLAAISRNKTNLGFEGFFFRLGATF